MNKDLLSLAGIILMSSAYVWGSRISHLETVKTRSWVSFSAGASVAYVFIHVFPEIGIFQQQMLGPAGGQGQTLSFCNQPLYLTALAGLCLSFFLDSIDSRFSVDGYGLKWQQHKHYKILLGARTTFFGLYNIMIAYVVTQRHGAGFLNILFIAIGLIFHFVVLNIRFSEMYVEFFQKHVRWLAVTGLFLGWLLGVTIKLPDAVVSITFAVIGGMITYVALKRELSETGNQAPYYFLTGAVIYSVLILAIPFFSSSGNIIH